MNPMMRAIAKLLLVANFTTGVTMGMELPEHPRLLFNRAGIAELSERLQRHEWAKAPHDGVDACGRGRQWRCKFLCPVGG